MYRDFPKIRFFSQKCREPHLHPGLGQPDPHRDLLPHEDVRVVRLGEAPLQLVQLGRRETGSVPLLFAIFVHRNLGESKKTGRSSLFFGTGIEGGKLPPLSANPGRYATFTWSWWMLWGSHSPPPDEPPEDPELAPPPTCNRLPLLSEVAPPAELGTVPNPLPPPCSEVRPPFGRSHSFGPGEE